MYLRRNVEFKDDSFTIDVEFHVDIFSINCLNVNVETWLVVALVGGVSMGVTYFQQNYKQAKGLGTRASRVNALHSICRNVMEYSIEL